MLIVEQAVVDDVLRQGADLGRQRRDRARSSAPCTSAGRRSAARRRATPRRRRSWWRSPTTAATPGRSTRSPRRPTTPSATRSTAAPSARTASGNAYVFGVGTSPSGGKQAFELMSRLDERRRSWSPAAARRGPVTQPGVFDPVQGRPVHRRRRRRAQRPRPAPSVDIANGAPTGADATNRIVMSYVSGTLAAPHVFFTESTDRGEELVDAAGDRDGRRPRLLHRAGDLAERHRRLRRLQRVHDAVPARPPRRPRALVGVVKHADSSPSAGRHGRVHASCTAAPPATRAAPAPTR